MRAKRLKKAKLENFKTENVALFAKEKSEIYAKGPHVALGSAKFVHKKIYMKEMIQKVGFQSPIYM